MVTLQELAERVAKLEQKVAELNMIKPRPKPREITPGELSDGGKQ